MLVTYLILGVLPVARAGLASSYAGETVTAVYPPPNATFSALATYFPDGSQVGNAGPTRTGDEAEAIATAPSAAKVKNVFPLSKPETSDKKENFDILQHVGNLSPWNSVKSFGLPNASPQIPHGCDIKQVHLLHRHGARYPTADSGPAKFASKLHTAAKGAGFSATGALSFLNTWTYKLGAEILTPFGREQLFNLGVGFRVKYGELLKGFDNLPVFRTTSEARMVDSALHFAAGFFGVQSYQKDYYQLIEIEGGGYTNTLAPYDTCNNSNNAVGDFGGVQARLWANVYLEPTLKRLGPLIKGVNLTSSDLVSMQQLCAYETVALGYSVFCGLFTEKEWKDFEYYNDLNFWYGGGPGNPATSAQGIGYVQEIVSRLTKQPITDFSKGVNRAIVSSNITFPLDQPIYVDATHDIVISFILTALNFTSLAANGPLPTDHIPKKQTYFVNQIAPFATNLVGQVLSCPASSEPTHIRWILNDAVLPLTGVKGCSSNENGLCELSTYIKSMKERINEVDYAFDCFANYSIPIPDTIVDGQYPQHLKTRTTIVDRVMQSQQVLQNQF